MAILPTTGFVSSSPTSGTTQTPNYQGMIDPQVQAQLDQQAQLERLRQQSALQQTGLNDASANFRSQLENATQLSLGGQQADTTRRGQDISLSQALRGFDVQSEGNRLQADTSKYSTDVGAATAQRGQDLSLRAALAPVDFQRQKFESILPMFTGLMNGTGTAGMFGNFQGGPNTVGGINLQSPDITVGGVYTPQQTQEQVNSGYARNAAMADTQRRRLGESAGQRGMSGQSPLLVALGGGIGAAQMGADAENKRETTLAHAKANAEQRLASEGLRANVWNQQNQGDIARRQIQSQQQNALLMALAGML